MTSASKKRGGNEMPLEEEVEQNPSNKTNIRCVVVHDLCKSGWLGPSGDVLVLCSSSQLIFLQTSSSQLHTYHSQHGIKCWTGHESMPMFAVADMQFPSRLSLVTYPDFSTMFLIDDKEMVEWYAVRLTSGELVVCLGVSAEQHFLTAHLQLVGVWCWRTHSKLASCQLNTPTTTSIFKCMESPTMLSFCICTPELGLQVWELTERSLLSLPAGNPQSPPSVSYGDAAYTQQRHLYVLDMQANLYSVKSDGAFLTISDEWKSPTWEDDDGRCRRVLLESYMNGFVVYCCDGCIVYLKRVSKEWVVQWRCPVQSSVLFVIVSGSSGLTESPQQQIVYATSEGHLNRLSAEGQTQTVLYQQRTIEQVCVMNAADSPGSVLALGDSLLGEYNSITGDLLSLSIVNDIEIQMSASLVRPLVSLCGEAGGVWVGAPGRGGRSLSLCDAPLEQLRWTPQADVLVTAALQRGIIFCLQVYNAPDGLLDLHVLRVVHVDHPILNMCLTRDTLLLHTVVGTILCYNLETGDKMKLVLKEVSELRNGCTQMLLRSAEEDDRAQVLLFTPLPQGYRELTLYTDKHKSVKCTDIQTRTLPLEVCGISMSVGAAGLVSWGMDGKAVITTATHISDVFLSPIGGLLPRDVVLSPNNVLVVLLGFAELLLMPLNKEKPSPVSQPDTSQHSTLHTISLKTAGEKHWLALQHDLSIEEERRQWQQQRDALMQQQQVLQEQLSQLLADNDTHTYTLPMEDFQLLPDLQLRLQIKAKEKRAAQRKKLEEDVLCLEGVGGWVVKHCYRGGGGGAVRELPPGQGVVEKYSLQGEGNTEVQAFRQKDLQTYEGVPVASDVTVGDKLLSPVPLSQQATSPGVSSVSSSLQQDMYEHTNLQLLWQAQDITESANCFRQEFNDKFNEIMSIKEKELASIAKKSERLKFIISELGLLTQLRNGDAQKFDIEISEARWSPEEQPHAVLTVQDHEVDVPRLEDAVVLVGDAALPVDAFRARFYPQALQHMMDGCLEKLWHEEIKKSILKPSCMVTKDPSEYTDEDKKAISAWQTEEKERRQQCSLYASSLRMEYQQLADTVNKGVEDFNARVRLLARQKLTVETKAAQQELKLMRRRYEKRERDRQQLRTQQMENELLVLEQGMNLCVSGAAAAGARAQEAVGALEAAGGREKQLEVAFRQATQHLPSVAQDMCLKLYKKRPLGFSRICPPVGGRLPPPASCTLTTGSLLATAAACVTKDTPLFLSPDCTNILKGLNQLDGVSNMPPILDDTMWATLCKHRRLKIENEIKMRAGNVSLTAAEAGAAAYRSRLAVLRCQAGALVQRLQILHQERTSSNRDSCLHVCVPSGAVCDPQTHSTQEALLICRDRVLRVNKQIKIAGAALSHSRQRSQQLQQRILQQEWQHKRLLLQAQHLSQQRDQLNNIKVTKEVMQHLEGLRARNLKHEQTQDKRINHTHYSFNTNLSKLMQHVEEIEMKSGAMEASVQTLEAFISHLKISISEINQRKTSIDIATKSQLMRSKRLETIMSRNKLLRLVQAQHATIMLLQTEVELQRLRTYPTLDTNNTHNA